MPKVGNPIGGERYKPQWAIEADLKHEMEHAVRREVARMLPMARLDDLQETSGHAQLQYGLTPVRVVVGDRGMAAVLDREGRTLFHATIGVAHQAATAINSLSPNSAELALQIQAKRYLLAILRDGASDAVLKEAREIIEEALTPADKREESGS